MAFTSMSDIYMVFGNLHMLWIDYGYILRYITPLLVVGANFEVLVHYNP